MLAFFLHGVGHFLGLDVRTFFVLPTHNSHPQLLTTCDCAFFFVDSRCCGAAAWKRRAPNNEVSATTETSGGGKRADG
jgi:hypothetical protein